MGVNILVIKLGALGDMVQALGPMAAIRRYHADVQVTALTTKPYAAFLRASGFLTPGTPSVTSQCRRLDRSSKALSQRRHKAGIRSANFGP